MTSDDITRMAREAGMAGLAGTIVCDMDELSRFATLVAAAEREECAKVCEECAGTVSMFSNSTEARHNNSAVKGCAAAIRERG